jgi:hypothetical protein
MTFQINDTDPKAMSNEALQAEVEQYDELAAAVVERLAHVLKELRARRLPHPFFAHPVLQFWATIADRRLSPKAALALANRHTIRAVLPLPHDQQEAIAAGREIDVAVLDSDGEVQVERMTINRMDQRTLRRVFGSDGIRSLADQEADLRRMALREKRVGCVTVLRDEQKLKIGNQKVGPEDLRAPLAALGYRLTLTRERAPRPDARDQMPAWMRQLS